MTMWAQVKRPSQDRTDRASECYAPVGLPRNISLEQHGRDVHATSDQPSTLPLEIETFEIKPGSPPEEELFRGTSGELTATPFQSPPWLKSWQNRMNCNQGETVLTAVGLHGGVPVLALPLTIVKRFNTRILSFQAYPLSDYTAPILNYAHPALLQGLNGSQVLRRIAQKLGSIDLIYVPKLPAVFADVKGPFLLQDGIPYHVRAHAVDLTKDASFEAFLQRSRSSKTRRRLREKLTALEKLGEVKFAFAQDVEEARRLIVRCLTSKARQLERQGHRDPFAEHGLRDFLIDHFANHAGSSTWACSYSVGGELVVTGMGFQGQNSWLLYQMALEDSDMSRYSPGTHMLLCLIRHCMEQKVSKLDLGLGDEPYKTEWCDIHTELLTSTIPLSPRGALVGAVLRAGTNIRRQLTAHPALYRQAKRVQNLARRLGLPA